MSPRTIDQSLASILTPEMRAEEKAQIERRHLARARAAWQSAAARQPNNTHAKAMLAELEQRLG